jgi:replicative superfamily II helicase
LVDFKKHLAGKKVQKPIDPVALYETLDRAVDKGPLRPAQTAVLSDWFANHQKTRDVIIKLHTGQGKTLIGLLMLQSRLNASAGPSVYLCPDNYLIDQTCEQAKQFGIATCKANPDLPDTFHNSKKILVTSVQKLFNGLTKFGLGNKSVPVGCLLMDDAHACSDIVREACRIRIPHDDPAYASILALFAEDLEQQGVGTYADITNDKRDAFLPIPYWAWIQRESQVASILSHQSARDSIKYAWPVLKDMLRFCQGVISGAAMEIEPYVPPLSMFGTYWTAEHRVFMSATVTDDAFLVKGLQLAPDTIVNPLTYAKERWSGEKMVLLPSLINESLTRGDIVKAYGVPNAKRKSGVVTLAPGFNWTKDWEKYGAVVANKSNVAESIDLLRQGKFDKTVVLVNRYDGIDLPDDMCRILIFDSKPFSESLIDLYQEMCRPASESTIMRTIRTIEQWMGRSVRGEKDYSVIVIIGTDITRLIRDKKSRRFLSRQMATQIEIGLEITEMAQKEIEDGAAAAETFAGLIKQCLGRDEGWKAFYAEKMDKVVPSGANEGLLKIFEVELEAERAFTNGDYGSALRNFNHYSIRRNSTETTKRGTCRKWPATVTKRNDPSPRNCKLLHTKRTDSF